MAAIRNRGGVRALVAGIALSACTAFAQTTGESPLHITSHAVFDDRDTGIAGAPLPAHGMRLSLAVMTETGWRAEDVLDAAKRAAGILAQCGLRTSIELYVIDGPERYRSLFTPVSRELAKRLALPKPTIFFVADTRNRPAFDAEAVGRGNSRTRPEMADTVWIASGARDLPVVIAHELAHVLADSGDHSSEAGNLMHDETRENSTRLTAAQCDAIVTTASANGLLRPLKQSQSRNFLPFGGAGWVCEGGSLAGKDSSAPSSMTHSWCAGSFGFGCAGTWEAPTFGAGGGAFLRALTGPPSLAGDGFDYNAAAPSAPCAVAQRRPLAEFAHQVVQPALFGGRGK